MTHVDRLAELSDHDVSIWLDSLSRGRLRGGGLAALVRGRHVVGVTTYPDMMYVTQLVAPDTVNTMPEATLDAVADHAQIGTNAIQSSYEDAAAVLEALPCVGVDYENVMSTLERDGVQRFVDSWNELISYLQAAFRADSERLSRMQPKCSPPTLAHRRIVEG